MLVEPEPEASPNRPQATPSPEPPSPILTKVKTEAPSTHSALPLPSGLAVDSLSVVGMSANQFVELQKRAAGRGRQATGTPMARKGPQHSVIIGIDPSLRGTGYGVIRLDGKTPETLAQGTIKCPGSWEHSRCFLQIVTVLREVIEQTKPTVSVMEGIFHAQNLKTAIVMGQARGAAMVPLAEAGLEIYEIATRKVKQAIVGYGGAQKSAVAKMVQRMLGLKKQPAADAADALALALTHANDMSRPSLKLPKKI